jgi:hypothetical protein
MFFDSPPWLREFISEFCEGNFSVNAARQVIIRFAKLSNSAAGGV